MISVKGMNMSKKTIQTFTIRIYCNKCRTYLYKYRKEGPGSLVKCFVSNILVNKTEESCICPKCGNQFARETDFKGRDVHKIIQGSIFVKGNTGKK